MSTDVKILGCAWSPRHGNSDIQVQEALRAAAELPGVTTEFYSIAGKKMNPCKSTYACERKPDRAKLCQCYKPTADAFHEVAELVMQADGIIFGCPVFWMSVTAELKAFMDRSMSVEMLGFPWRNKVAGFLTVAWDRNGGQEHTIQAMQIWAMMHDLYVVGVGPERPERSIGGYTGAMAIQGFPFPDEGLDAISQDEVGLYATRCVGWRVAETAKLVKAGLATVGPEEMKWGAQGMDICARANEALASPGA
jgi:multimeric flavodoxin WrbA